MQLVVTYDHLGCGTVTITYRKHLFCDQPSRALSGARTWAAAVRSGEEKVLLHEKSMRSQNKIHNLISVSTTSPNQEISLEHGSMVAIPLYRSAVI